MQELLLRLNPIVAKFSSSPTGYLVPPSSVTFKVDLARFLVEQGANVAAQDERGLTPLHLASQQSPLDFAQFLVEHGANAAAQDQDGSTPFHVASERGHHSLAQFLVEHNANAAAQTTPQIQQPTT